MLESQPAEAAAQQKLGQNMLVFYREYLIYSGSCALLAVNRSDSGLLHSEWNRNLIISL